jgi:hypothetical protein
MPWEGLELDKAGGDRVDNQRVAELAVRLPGAIGMDVAVDQQA